MTRRYGRARRGQRVQDAVDLAEERARRRKERARRRKERARQRKDDDEDDGVTPVFWVTDPPRVRSGKGFKKTIQTYGNEPALDVVYWRIWIFARVGPVGERETA